MVCLESRDEQTADEFEIEDGMEEGIEIINRVDLFLWSAMSKAESVAYVFNPSIAYLIVKDALHRNSFPIRSMSFLADTLALAIGQLGSSLSRWLE